MKLIVGGGRFQKTSEIQFMIGPWAGLDVLTLPATTLLFMRILAIAMLGPWTSTGSREFLPRQRGPEPNFASMRLHPW